MTKYTRRADEFEAVQWSGSNWHEVLAFAGHGNVETDGKVLFLRVGDTGSITVPKGWWVMRYQNGELRASDPAAFDELYEEVPEELSE